MARHTPFQLLILCGFVIIIGQSATVPPVNNTHVNDTKVHKKDDVPRVNVTHVNDTKVDKKDNVPRVNVTQVNDTKVHKKDDVQSKQPFTLDEIYNYVYYSLGFNGTWISDNEIMVSNIISGDVKITDVKTGKTENILKGKNLPPVILNTATISPDRRYILIAYNTKRVFRYSSIKNYIVYDVQNETYEKIANEAFISLAFWSPVGSELVYVLDNDIYHMTLNNIQNVRKLTFNGERGIIYNGIPDWIYEEEVFASPTGMWYSPNGQYLAFATFNDVEVKDIAYFHYGEPGSFKDQYPTQVKIKYPKAGTINPSVSLSVIDLIDPWSAPIALEAPIDVVTSDHVLYTVNWWDETHVIATWTNRVQNRSQLIMYNIGGYLTQTDLILYEEETKGWLQPNNPIKVGDYALHLKREDSGTNAGKFRHINRYEYQDNRFIKPVDLTPGPSEVHKILAVDSVRNKIYYLATAPGKPTQRNLYSVPVDGSQKPTCISCEVRTPEGNNCTYATASFSSQRSYYSLTCLGPDPATVTINDEKHKPIMTWRTNELTRKLLSQRLLPRQKDLNITVNGYDSRVRMFLPPNFSENKTYPLLVYVYGGPNSVRILDNSNFGFEHYLATNRSVIYAWIDGRGSAFKGSNMLFEIYRKMGTVEIQDTIAVTEILQKQHKWIDANRTGIWGWSYGGFHTGMVLSQDAKSVFKCGISVAPVTNWIYYDSIYTERYMGLPTVEDNLSGYERTDIMRQSKGIRGKKYMLIHGTADDNVHYQQAMMLAKSLEHEDILFQQITYTDETHDLKHVHPHLYHTMDKFWGECFKY